MIESVLVFFSQAAAADMSATPLNWLSIQDVSDVAELVVTPNTTHLLSADTSNVLETTCSTTFAASPDVSVPGPFYQCKLCSFLTPESSVIRAHVVTSHPQGGSVTPSGGIGSSLRPFACPHCRYQAAQKQALVSHLRTHTGERPFACPHCPYRSTLKHHLTRHVAALHKHLPAPVVSKHPS